MEVTGAGTFMDLSHMVLHKAVLLIFLPYEALFWDEALRNNREKKMLQTLSSVLDRGKLPLFLPFFTLSPRSLRYFPGLCGPEIYISTKYFISLTAFPNSLWGIVPDVAGPQAQPHMHLWTQSFAAPYLVTPSYIGRCSTSNSNDNIDMSKHSDRTYRVPGNVLGTIHKSIDLTLTTALWGRY